MEDEFSQLSRRFGVTRTARLTGLDRCGVEVFAAVRPRGHVLQVSQGKGLDVAGARWSALGEAIELAVAEQVDPTRLHFAEAPANHAWSVGQERVGWVTGVNLTRGEEEWVPAQEVYCPPAGAPWLGPASSRWRSNGLGFHPSSRGAAVAHALAEVIERDAVARALPHGWTEQRAVERLVAPPPLAIELHRRGFGAFCFDLSSELGPVAGALLFDLEGGPVPLTAGYACRPHFGAAALAALLEAAQSRLTEIHGAREDVTLGHREQGGSLLRLLTGLHPRPPPRQRGLRPPADLAVVTLSSDPWVVKAVSPSLLCSQLLE